MELVEDINKFAATPVFINNFVAHVASLKRPERYFNQEKNNKSVILKGIMKDIKDNAALNSPLFNSDLYIDYEKVVMKEASNIHTKYEELKKNNKSIEVIDLAKFCDLKKFKVAKTKCSDMSEADMKKIREEITANLYDIHLTQIAPPTTVLYSSV